MWSQACIGLPLCLARTTAHSLHSHGVQALADAGLDWQGDALQQLDKLRCGILMGTAMGGMNTFTTAIQDLLQKVRASGCKAQKCCSALSGPVHQSLL